MNNTHISTFVILKTSNVKHFLIVVCIAFLIVGCKNNKEETEVKKTSYKSFGNKINNDKALTKEEMAEKFYTLTEGDTLNVKFASTVNKVCVKKGCWMKLDLGNENESMVRFKDYGFFVPKNIDNKKVIVEGKAYITKISVDKLRHYAKDGGKSKEEIAAITEPELTYAFEANGVLLKD